MNPNIIKEALSQEDDGYDITPGEGDYSQEDAAFLDCVDRGGRVRRVSGPSKKHGLKEGEYVNYCYIDGKSFRGEVKKKKDADEDEEDDDKK